MAGSLRNISALLSPRFISPLSPARKNFAILPKSDVRRHNLHPLSRPQVVKKLNFSPLKDPPSHIKVPTIKVHSANQEPIEEFFVTKSRKPTNSNVLVINTPNKLELIENGLDKLKTKMDILGKGSFGTVFKGVSKGQLVAVKIVPKNCSRREKNALGLSHENIVKTMEIIEKSPDYKYDLIIMELWPNSKTLQEVLENSIKAEGLLHQHAIDITRGLDYLHAKGVLHLDLKPKNILVIEKMCKICDFGSSSKVGEESEKFEFLGTPVYTAPEVLLGQIPTIKSDIYSLGIVFWQLRYKKYPFEEYERVETIIYNVAKFGMRPICPENDKGEVVTLFTKCWHDDPELRPTTSHILEHLKYVKF